MTARKRFESVDEYLASQPDSVRGLLDRVRKTIRKAVPEAEEVISYNMPAYKLAGGHLIYFAGWKQHFSLYPAPDNVLTVFKAELNPCVISRGTIRFPYSESPPLKLIAAITKLRAREITESEKRGNAARNTP